MKKIAAIALGLGLVLGSVSVSFAQDAKPTKSAKKSTKAPKGKKSTDAKKM